MARETREERKAGPPGRPSRKVPWISEGGNRPSREDKGKAMVQEAPTVPAGARVARVKGGRRELIEGEERTFVSSEDAEELIIVNLNDAKPKGKA